MARTLTVKAYYKHFKSIFGVMTAAVSSIPILSGLMPADYSRYLFPPIGRIESFVRIGSIVLAGMITITVYYSKNKSFVRNKKNELALLSGILLVAVVSLSIFIGLNYRFVRSIPVPSISPTEQFVVSVGYNRTEYAQKEFGQASDWDILRQRGVTEEEIFGLWTPTSIIVARLALWFSYVTFLLAAVATGSFAVLFDKLGVPAAE